MCSIEVDNFDSEDRPGMDLVMVIDISGSMAGTKLKLVKETLTFLVHEL